MLDYVVLGVKLRRNNEENHAINPSMADQWRINYMK
jgi:hypothetical protein